MPFRPEEAASDAKREVRSQDSRSAPTEQKHRSDYHGAPCFA